METKKLKSLKKVKVKDKEEERIDLEAFIVESQNVKYKDQIKKEFKADKKGTISKEQSLMILEKYQNTKSDELIECISESDNESVIEIKPEKSLKENIIDFSKNLFKYANKQFAFIQTPNEIYFKGKDIAEYLEYDNTKQAITHHVSDEEKITLEELLISENFKGLKFRPLKRNEKN